MILIAQTLHSPKQSFSGHGNNGRIEEHRLLKGLARSLRHALHDLSKAFQILAACHLFLLQTPICPVESSNAVHCCRVRLGQAGQDPLDSLGRALALLVAVLLKNLKLIFWL